MKSTSETMYQRKESLTETFFILFLDMVKLKLQQTRSLFYHRAYILLNFYLIIKKMEFVGVVTVTASIKPLC